MNEADIALFDFEIFTEEGDSVYYVARWGPDVDEAFSFLIDEVGHMCPHDVVFEHVHTYRPSDGPTLVWWMETAEA